MLALLAVNNVCFAPSASWVESLLLSVLIQVRVPRPAAIARSVPQSKTTNTKHKTSHTNTAASLSICRVTSMAFL